MFVGLNVIGVRMTCERPSCEKRANICSKQNIEKRSKNRSLGWAKRSVTPRRTRRMKGDRSRPFRKIGCKPDKWKVPYPKSYGDTFQEDIMVHGVESSAHIKQSKKCYLGPVLSAIDVRQEAEKEGLSRVTLTEPGLTWRKEIVHVQIVKQLTSYQFFNNFRNESNISYRSIARWNRWVKSRLLNNRCDDRALLGRRENSFTKRGVAQQSEEQYKDIYQLLDEVRRKKIQFR